MKKILFSLLAVAITFTSMAQNTTETQKKEAKHENKKGNKTKGDALQNLNLTATQKSELKVINDDFRQQMQTLRSNSSADDIRTKREALMKDHQQRVDNILTPEQKIQAKNLRTNHVKKGNGVISRGGNERNDKSKQLGNLNLTTDQQTKAKAYNESFKNSMQEVQKNTALTEDQKKEQVNNLRQKHKEDIQSMLTTEQKENLKNQVKNRPNKKAVK